MMKRNFALISTILITFLAIGCGDDDSSDGGSTDGGSTDGGSTDGGSTDGGSTDGGSTDGGSTDGGSTDGGSSNDVNSSLEDLLNECALLTEGDILNFGVTSCMADCLKELSCDELKESACAEEPDLSLEFIACYAICFEQDPKFTCEDGSEIPGVFACDGDPDCADASDEVGCSEFTCGDGESIPSSWECDGEADCEDASDEAGCAQPICD